jgi:hypothetical protein
VKRFRPICLAALAQNAPEALRSRPRRHPRPRIRSRGVMESWSVGVLCQVRIAPSSRDGGAIGLVSEERWLATLSRPLRAGPFWPIEMQLVFSVRAFAGENRIETVLEVQ